MRATFGEMVNRILIKKIPNLPENFSLHSGRVVDKGFVLYKGAIEKQIKSGPRKGRYRWLNKDVHEVLISHEEIEKEEQLYEEETGLCAECLGKAEKCCGWSIEDGHRYKPCSKCKGTGKAQIKCQQQS